MAIYPYGAIKIKHGDSWPIAVTVRIDGRAIESTEDIEVFELTFGGVPYEWKSDGTGRVTWDAEEKAFIFWPTQEETFALQTPTASIDWRVKFTSGIVDGGKTGKIPVYVVESDSSEVL